MLYVVVALTLAALAAMLVRVFAPYACGSGIPEVSQNFLYSHCLLSQYPCCFWKTEQISFVPFKNLNPSHAAVFR